MPKKPSPDFEVFFEGNRVLPEKIPLGVLNQALSAIRQLATGHEDILDSDEDAEVDEDKVVVDDGRISLLDVKRGSTILRFVCPPNIPAIENLRSAGRIIRKPNDFGKNDYVLNPIRRLSAVAAYLDCSIVVRRSGANDGTLAKIERTSYASISKSLFVSGETSFRGRVERAGGSTSMRCSLRLPNRNKLLYCSVANKDLVRVLGDLLYSDVNVQGHAVWIKKSWRVISFEIKSVSKIVSSGSLSDAFQAMRDAGGSAWDNVANPKEFLEEVSGK